MSVGSDYRFPGKKKKKVSLESVKFARRRNRGN